jgi:hypothetical protein
MLVRCRDIVILVKTNRIRIIVICVHPNTKNIFSFNLDIYTKMKHFKVILKKYL